MAEFTEEEKRVIAPFFTNLDKPVFALKNLPEVVKGALFSRYSRSAKSLRRVLLDEFINKPEMGFTDIVGKQGGGEQLVAIQKAEEFYSRVLVGYGDDSVGELGGAHLAVENVSQIAAKIIEDSRIGISPLEKSTRYVRFDDREDGKWRYYREPRIMDSVFAKMYEKTCDMLFEAYSSMAGPMMKFVEKSAPLETSRFFDAAQQREIPYGEMKDEKLKKRAETAYRSSVRANALDILRVILPASTLTNIGLFGNGRAFEYLLVKMYSGGLAEAKETAKAMHNELMCVIPSFVKRADDRYGKAQQEYLAAGRERVSSLSPIGSSAAEDIVKLADYEKEPIDRVCAHIMYPASNASLGELLEFCKGRSMQEKLEIIDSYVGVRKNRRQKPGRAFENIYYTFDILADFGIYRDLQRHSVLTQERQLLTCFHGYEVPAGFREAGLEKGFREAMETAREAWERVYEKYPEEAQYVVPMAYRIRWYFTINLRELFHFIELRTMPQGHPAYRLLCQKMLRELEKTHPYFAKHFRFADMSTYYLGRLKSELKTEEKRESFG